MTFQSSCRVSKSFRSFFDVAADVCRRILRGLRSPSGPTELLRRTRSASGRWKTDHPSRDDRPNRKKTGRRAAQPPRLHTPPGPGLAPKVRGPVSKTLGSVLAGGLVGAHTARTGAQSCVELLRLSRRTHPRLEAHRSADPGGGRQLTTVQAKETDRKIFFARKSATLELRRRRGSVGY